MYSLGNFGRGLALAVLGAALAALPAHADTTLGGSYDNQTTATNQTGDGYDTTTGGVYTVLPGATFDGNATSGLNINNAATPVTVNITGGDFSHNGFDGIFTSLGSTENISGGTFNGNFDGIGAFNSTVNITGGDFTGNNSLSLLSYGSSITLYGDFSTYGLLPSVATYTVPHGTFTGRLQNDTTTQTFTYGELNGGTVTLAPIPEPSSIALLALGLLPVAFIARKRRRSA